MFVVGLGGFIHEVAIAQAERPMIIAACCALMGLPFVLRGEETLRDEKTRREDGEGKE
jgi:hypothetical protein